LIQIDLQKYHQELADFLSIGKQWLFVPGYVYTTNDAKNVFARLVMQGLEIDETIDPLMQMDRLEDLLKMKSVKTLKISVRGGFLMVDRPDFQMQKQIGRVEKQELVDKLKGYDVNCRALEKAGPEMDGFPVCNLEVPGDLLSDALDGVGSPKEPIRIETGNSLRITSDSGQDAVLPKVVAEQTVRIGLSMEAQEHLRKAISSTTRIKITEKGPYCIFKSPRLTVMAGGLAPKT
jgi:hypothetical protein